MKQKILHAIGWGIRLVLGITFIWASLHKIVSPEDFARILYGYGVFPGFSINVLAIWVPFVEFVAGVCLITGGYNGKYQRGALLLINAMLVCFVLVIGFNLIRGHEFDCGCFSVAQGDQTSDAVGLLLRDLVMLGAGLWLWYLTGKDRGLLHADDAKA